MEQLTIFPGRNKSGETEIFSPLCLQRGDMVGIVGNTGSGKSRLIKDVEQLVQGDSVSGRYIRLDGEVVSMTERLALSTSLIAHLGQSMGFVLDSSVEAFLAMHIKCRKSDVSPAEVIRLANEMTPEEIGEDQPLTVLSGGQTRALMVADIALVCQSPVVLIDEIENAGINKSKALQVLAGSDKIVLVVTHDSHTALLCGKRVWLENGGIQGVAERTQEEEALLLSLEAQYERQCELQKRLRKGEWLA